MTLKTVRGNSIQAAMTEARRQFGDEIVLMQANPPDGNLQAEIIVSLEDRSRGTVSELRQSRATPAPRAYARTSTSDELSTLAAAGLGYPGLADSYASEAYRYVAPHESRGPQISDETPTNDSATDATTSLPQPQSVLGKIAERIRGIANKARAIVERQRRTFQAPDGSDQRSQTAGNATGDAPRPLAFLEAIDRRISAIEGALGSSIIGYDARWRLHPAYADMVSRGLSAETAAALLATLATRGIRSDADDLAIRRDLSDELRRRMKVVIARRTRGRHMFVGPSGCGKTAMIAGLATDPRLGRVLVIVAQPAELGSVSLVDPAFVYDRLGVDSISVHSSRQLGLEAETLERYDTILVDTPPIELADTQKQADTLSSMLSSISRLTVHLVVDTRHDLGRAEHMLNESDTAIDAVALAHLDGLDRPGRLAEFFTRCRRTVYFASNAPGSRAGKHIFSPSRLASDTLNIGQWYSDGELTEYFNKERQARPRFSTLTPDSGYGRERLELNGRV